MSQKKLCNCQTVPWSFHKMLIFSLQFLKRQTQLTHHAASTHQKQCCYSFWVKRTPDVITLRKSRHALRIKPFFLVLWSNWDHIAVFQQNIRIIFHSTGNWSKHFFSKSEYDRLTCVGRLQNGKRLAQRGGFVSRKKLLLSAANGLVESNFVCRTISASIKWFSLFELQEPPFKHTNAHFL